MAERIKITLRWIQILDSKEPFYKERGEFRFLSRVTADGGEAVEVKFPSQGYYEISDNPAWNKLNLERAIFEGEVEDSLTVVLTGEEIDFISANDQLERYERSFSGSPTSWIGEYGPGDFEADIHPDDPEVMTDWKVSYKIEAA